jgi:hypothetical protein
MSSDDDLKYLSPLQRSTILELGSGPTGGQLDPVTISRLLTMGIVEIRGSDRQLVLTERGRLIHDELAGND